MLHLLCLLAAAKSEPLRLIPPEPDNTTDVEDCIKRAKANDSSLNRININNIKEIKAEVLKELLNSLKENKYVEILEMANVGMTDSVGKVRWIEKLNSIVFELISFLFARFWPNYSKKIRF